MQRRLNLAAGMVHDPEVLLCDEPTVGVDPQSRNHLYERIERLRDEGRTILYTTHYMEEAQRLCNRVAILDHGAVLALGSPDELIAAHGGTAAVTAELAGPRPAGLELPGSIDGQSLRFESNAPLAEVARLVEKGLRFDSLSIQQPDLESVFLALTGRRLRDD
jgi:ABC-2 type transport system ATP-binding protein